MIDEGLAGDARAAAKGRVILRDMVGDVSLWRGDLGSLWATYKQDMWAVVRSTAVESMVGVTGFEPATPTSRT